MAVFVAFAENDSIANSSVIGCGNPNSTAGAPPFGGLFAMCAFNGRALAGTRLRVPHC
ncbi:hypothetical protein PTE30175_04466 [Pandoraea terrae]|uniref:Uncharacterized protein n=1 Tax=Pandoraea terrae TaxID=1537710 RepID=A0A5E4YLL0_9BURK|nr:hypothetical protein PTE30175_04466 [Pandoraea terrae]